MVEYELQEDKGNVSYHKTPIVFLLVEVQF